MVALVTIGLALLASTLGAHAQNVPTYQFLSRPDIIAPELIVTTLTSEAYDGYTFLTPNSPTKSNFTVAMYMYNNNGSLVWSGQKFNNPGHAITDFYSCTYQGAPHLCVIMFEGPTGGGQAVSSYGLILDSSYNQVQTVAPSAMFNGTQLTQDLHEFNVINNGETALLSSYAPAQYNVTLPDCPGSPTVQYVKAGLFSEVTTDGKNTTLFEWNSLDHVNVTDTYICPGQATIGNGATAATGIDFFHINAIDKNSDGDYLVSSRYFSTVFKIAGLQSPSGQSPGSIIWRLGGKSNSFQHMDTDLTSSGSFNFSNQHHARFTSTGITLWDNANDAISPASAKMSSGMSIDIDTDSSTATLTYQALPPDGALDSSQGDHQVLDNGNHFCGMGSVPQIYERTPSGELAMDAHFGVLPMQSYRAFKYEWSGTPSTSELKLFAYAHNCTANTVYYVSWNGATEVDHYDFFSSSSPNGTFNQSGTASKDFNFETMAVGTSVGLYSYAQAVDAYNQVLGQTPTVQTFVPASSLAGSCGDFQCPSNTTYSTAPQASCGTQRRMISRHFR